MKLSELVLNYRQQNGISQRQFAAQSGLSNGYVAMIEKDQNPGTGKPLNVSIDALRKIASGMGTSIDELLRVLDDDQAISLDPHIPDLPGIIPIQTRRIPLLGDIACGTPSEPCQDFDCYVTAGTDVRADYALRAHGDSMIGARIHDGDIVFIRSQPTVDDGEIAAVLIDGETTLKRVRHVGGQLLFLPENQAYAPIIAAADQDVRILGKAIAFQSDVR